MICVTHHTLDRLGHESCLLTTFLEVTVLGRCHAANWHAMIHCESNCDRRWHCDWLRLITGKPEVTLSQQNLQDNNSQTGCTTPCKKFLRISHELMLTIIPKQYNYLLVNPPGIFLGKMYSGRYPPLCMAEGTLRYVTFQVWRRVPLKKYNSLKSKPFISRCY